MHHLPKFSYWQFKMRKLERKKRSLYGNNQSIVPYWVVTNVMYGYFIIVCSVQRVMELAPYTWIKHIPDSSCARLSGGIRRPLTWKKSFFLFTRSRHNHRLGKVQANALTYYCAIYMIRHVDARTCVTSLTSALLKHEPAHIGIQHNTINHNLCRKRA